MKQVIKILVGMYVVNMKSNRDETLILLMYKYKPTPSFKEMHFITFFYQLLYRLLTIYVVFF